jgi:tetratricopeptide (TPR) repeat protein
LIEAATDRHLWADNFDREMRDILALHSDVARAIAREIKIAVTPEETRHLASARPVNPEAYQLYLKGRYFFWERWPQGLEKAVEYFEQAIEIAPTYAPAYAGLALCYSSLGYFQPPQEVSPKAKAAAMKALEMDETLAEAYTALGKVRQNVDWDWPGAERAFRRAVELNQSSAEAHAGYSGYLVRVGRFDEAIAESKRALELDPVSLGTNLAHAWVSMKARRYDEAIAQYKKTLELDPDYGLARTQLAWSYAFKGMYAEALAEYKKLGEPSASATLGYVLAVSGRRSQALKVLENVRRLSAEQYIGPFRMAILYAGLGDKDLALESLEKAYEQRSAGMHLLKIEPWFNGLRDDPRFQSLLRRMNFPSR